MSLTTAEVLTLSLILVNLTATGWTLLRACQTWKEIRKLRDQS